MTTLINSILRQSLKTFKNQTAASEVFKTNFNQLKSMLDTLTVDHVNFDPRLLQDEIWEHPQKAPMTYIQLYEDDHICMAIFVLKPGSKLPLHDHPHMHGLLKVIAGKVKIKNYSVQVNGNSDIIAEQSLETIVEASSECCVVKPVDNNLHEIECVEGASAFLDVLAPPYDTYIPELGPRKCSYYTIVDEVSENVYHLRECPAPSWFWSDHGLYQGPKLEAGPDEKTEVLN